MQMSKILLLLSISGFTAVAQAKDLPHNLIAGKEVYFPDEEATMPLETQGTPQSNKSKKKNKKEVPPPEMEGSSFLMPKSEKDVFVPEQ